MNAQRDLGSNVFLGARRKMEADVILRLRTFDGLKDALWLMDKDGKPLRVVEVPSDVGFGEFCLLDDRSTLYYHGTSGGASGIYRTQLGQWPGELVWGQDQFMPPLEFVERLAAGLDGAVYVIGRDSSWGIIALRLGDTTPIVVSDAAGTNDVLTVSGATVYVANNGPSDSPATSDGPSITVNDVWASYSYFPYAGAPGNCYFADRVGPLPPVPPEDWDSLCGQTITPHVHLTTWMLPGGYCCSPSHSGTRYGPAIYKNTYTQTLWRESTYQAGLYALVQKVLGPDAPRASLAFGTPGESVHVTEYDVTSPGICADSGYVYSSGYESVFRAPQPPWLPDSDDPMDVFVRRIGDISYSTCEVTIANEWITSVHGCVDDTWTAYNPLVLPAPYTLWCVNMPPEQTLISPYSIRRLAVSRNLFAVEVTSQATAALFVGTAASVTKLPIFAPDGGGWGSPVVAVDDRWVFFETGMFPEYLWRYEGGAAQRVDLPEGYHRVVTAVKRPSL
jgi:hypothetical protein